MRDPACIFCKVISVELPAAVVFEDDSAVAFLDVGPLAEGHTLLVPRRHAATLADMPGDEVARVLAHLPRIGRAVMKVSGAAGFNVLINNGAVAGQVVRHAHIHIIPRKAGDGLGYRWSAGKYPPGRDVEVAAALNAELAHAH